MARKLTDSGRGGNNWLEIPFWEFILFTFFFPCFFRVFFSCFFEKAFFARVGLLLPWPNNEKSSAFLLQKAGPGQHPTAHRITRNAPTMAHAIIHSVHLIQSDPLIPIRQSPLLILPSPERLSQPACLPAKPSQAKSSPVRHPPPRLPPSPHLRARRSSSPAPNGDRVPAALAAVHLTPTRRRVGPRRAQAPAALRRPLQRRRR